MRMSSLEPAVKHVGGAACLTRRLGVYQLPAFAVLIGGSGSQGRFEVGGVLRPQTNGASSPTGGLIARPRLIGGRVGATVARAQLWAGPGWRISAVGVCGDVLEQTRLDTSATPLAHGSSSSSGGCTIHAPDVDRTSSPTAVIGWLAVASTAMTVPAAASGIASARKKLARASERVAALRAAIEDYRSSSPPTFGVQSIGNQAGMSTIHIAVSITDAVPIPD